MKMVMMAAVIAVGMVAAGIASAQDGAAVAKKSGCLNCHDVDAKKVGPPLKEGAAKLKGKSNADAVAAIKSSKAHGAVKASDADLQTINTWMQSGFARAAGM